MIDVFAISSHHGVIVNYAMAESHGARFKTKGELMSKDCKTGLDDRCRDLYGEIRQKRGDTLVGTLRKTYGADFAPGKRVMTRSIPTIL